MSKENLLKEGTVRRFMTLAGTQPLASDFITEKRSDLIQEQEEGLEEPLPGGEEELPAEDEFADVEMEEPGLEPEEEPGEEGDIEDAVRAMVDAIADVASDFGVDVEVGEEEPVELEPGEIGAEEEGEFEDEEEGGLEGEEEEGPEEMALQEDDGQVRGEGDSWREAGIDKCMKLAEKSGKPKTKEQCGTEYDKAKASKSLEEINYIDEDAVMNEVFHRVKNRLVQEKRTDDMASMLAEKIARRMNKRR